jgi:hypothetical protein
MKRTQKTTALAIIVQSDEALIEHDGDLEVIKIKDLRSDGPRDIQSGEEFTEGLTYAEFRKACFNHNHSFHPLLNPNNSGKNGRMIAELCRQRGIEPGFRQEARRQGSSPNKRVVLINVYPFEVLCEWLEKLVNPSYEPPSLAL